MTKERKAEMRAVLKEREAAIKRLRYVIRKMPSTLTCPFFYSSTSVEVALVAEELPREEVLAQGEEKVRVFRRELRKAFGTWSDKVQSIQPLDSTVRVSYVSTSVDVPVWFEVHFPLEGFEKTGLLSPGCRIETQVVEEPARTREYKAVVCGGE